MELNYVKAAPADEVGERVVSERMQFGFDIVRVRARIDYAVTKLLAYTFIL